MAKNKKIRSMSKISASQQVVEQSVNDKFVSVQKFIQKAKPIATKVVKKQSVAGRINPQLSCTIEPEDKELLNKLALYACNRENKLLNTSIIVRALIRLGSKHKDELVF